MHYACFFLFALAASAGENDQLKEIIQKHINTKHKPSTSSTTNNCHNKLGLEYVNMRLSGGCEDGEIADEAVCEVEAKSGGHNCSVNTLTCVNGAFDPPRASCKQNQCSEGWESSSSDSNSFGKIAELSDAQSYLYMDEGQQKNMVKLTVYVNKRWFGDDGNFANVDLYVTDITHSNERFKGDWTNSNNDDDLKAEIPSYFREGDDPCVVAMQLKVPWSDWTLHLDTSMRAYKGNENVNLNQVIVEIQTKEDYVAWDARLGFSPDAPAPSLKQDIEKTLNVIIKYPHVVTAKTPVFTLTDEKHVDVQITKLAIHDVHWGVSATAPPPRLKADETRFIIEMTVESQVQAPFKLNNIKTVGKGTMRLENAGGWAPKRDADCQVAKDFKSPNGRFFTVDDIQICSQEWSMKQEVTLGSSCEIPIDFGFEWEMGCVGNLYSESECPLYEADSFSITLADLVDAPDVLWICPHMISEHPVWTTFTTYRKPTPPSGERPAAQKVFVANEQVYAQIDLETAWGFLSIASAEIVTMTLEYDRRVAPGVWSDLASDKEKCGDGAGGDIKVTEDRKCEYVLKKNKAITELARKDCSFVEENPGQKGSYEANVSDDEKYNRHKYTLGFSFKLAEGVFPQPHASCDASTWTEEGGAKGDMKGSNYQKQTFLGGGGTNGRQAGIDCEFTKGAMKFIAEVDVTYSDGGRRRVLIEHKPATHKRDIMVRTAIVVESQKEAQYEEALNVEALRQFASFGLKKEEPAEKVLAQEEDTPPGPPENTWEIPTGAAVAVAALLVLLMLLCYLHHREKKSDKLFDESMASLLKRYPPDTERANDQIVEKKVNFEDLEKEKLDDNVDIEDNVLGRSMMVPVSLQPAPTAIAAFGEDAPDPDDLPDLPFGERRNGNDTESLPQTHRASSTAPNSTRGTILHAVHSVQSVPSYRHHSVQSVTSCRSVASNTTVRSRPRTPHEESCHSSATIRSTSRITSKRGTEERATMTMSTCTDYVIDRGPDAPV